MKLTGKYIRYGRQHVHVYTYSHSRQEWICVGCRMNISGMDCAADNVPRPRGFKFDGAVTLNEYETRAASI
jgi:hypothetical protein